MFKLRVRHGKVERVGEARTPSAAVFALKNLVRIVGGIEHDEFNVKWLDFCVKALASDQPTHVSEQGDVRVTISKGHLNG